MVCVRVCVCVQRAWVQAWTSFLKVGVGDWTEGGVRASVHALTFVSCLPVHVRQANVSDVCCVCFCVRARACARARVCMCVFACVRGVGNLSEAMLHRSSRAPVTNIRRPEQLLGLRHLVNVQQGMGAPCSCVWGRCCSRQRPL